MFQALTKVNFPFEFVSKGLKDDEEFVLKVLTISFDKSFLKFVSFRLMNNYSFMEKVFNMEFFELGIRLGSPLQYIFKSAKILNEKEKNEKRRLDRIIPPFFIYKEIEALFEYQYKDKTVKKLKIDVPRNKFIFTKQTGCYSKKK